MEGLARSLAVAFQLFETGRRPEAARICARVLAQAPHHPDALHLRGAIAYLDGRLGEAVPSILAAIALAPARVVPHNTLGCAELAAGDAVAAAASHRRALALQPDFAEAAINLGAALKGAGDPEGALAACRRASELAPDSASAQLNLGAVLDEAGAYAEAAHAFRRAMELSPAEPAAPFNLARALMPQGQLGAALASYERALALAPQWSDAHMNLGNVHLAMGALDSATASFRRARALAPGNPRIHSNLLFAMVSNPRIDEDTLFAEYRRWDDCHGRPRGQTVRAHANDPDPERQLRVGYLSADLRVHAMTNNIDGLYFELDPAAFELFGYAEVARPDEVTEALRRRARGWRSTVGVSDREVAEMIRADGIDILVSLGGHTSDNRIGVCAYRPAPIQVSFADISTSGLAAMDYWLTDPVVHPADTAERFTETLVRLPVFMTHRAPADAPDLAPPPVMTKGVVTFGSCNNLGKLNPAVIALWARVLQAVPGSRLLLKYVNRFADPAVRERFVDLFAGHGIGAERIAFNAEVLGRARHLDILNEIDIALDPFPFNGCTTSFEALWMGVPFVTLSGTRFVGRMGEGMLRRIGLDDLVAPDEAAYVRIAAGLARDPARLAALRAELRQSVAQSPLCDHAALGDAVGRAFRQRWQDWCARQQRR
jgi:predicted O-linked N-acetylglucosamine transferase (SPINDLY family)